MACPAQQSDHRLERATTREGMITRTRGDSLRGSSIKIGTIQRVLASPLRKDDTHKSRSVNIKTNIKPGHEGLER